MVDETADKLFEIVKSIEFPYNFHFNQKDIDVARNATDDFNPWHDRWRCDFPGNPFKGPIALGFQLEGLVEFLTTVKRIQEDNGSVAHDSELDFVNYSVTFRDAVSVDEKVYAEVGNTKVNEDGSVSNSFSVKSNVEVNGKARSLAKLKGRRVDTKEPIYLPDADFSGVNLSKPHDKLLVPGTDYWLKSKHLNTGNAKNFLNGCGVEQYFYFDEINERVRFPDLFPVSFVSGALLQKGLSENYDHSSQPMMYTSHRISVNRRMAEGLLSNARVNILISKPETVQHELKINQDIMYRCYGVMPDGNILFRAEIYLTPLQQVLKAKGL